MFEKIVVAAIIVVALLVALCSAKKALSGKGKGCRGGCACSDKSKQGCSQSGPTVHELKTQQK